MSGQAKTWTCKACGKEAEGTTHRLPLGWVGDTETRCEACRRTELADDRSSLPRRSRGKR